MAYGLLKRMRNSYRRAFSSFKLNNILLFGLFKRTSVYYSKYDNYNVPKPFLLYFHKTLIYLTHYDKVICFILSSPIAMTIIKHHRLPRFDISCWILQLFFFSFVTQLLFNVYKYCNYIVLKNYIAACDYTTRPTKM